MTNNNIPSASSQLQGLIAGQGLLQQTQPTITTTAHDLKVLDNALYELEKKHLAIAKDQEERIVELESVVGKLMEELNKIKIPKEKPERSIFEMDRKNDLMQMLEQYTKAQQMQKAVQTYQTCQNSYDINPGRVVA